MSGLVPFWSAREQLGGVSLACIARLSVDCRWVEFA